MHIIKVIIEAIRLYYM